MRPRHYSPLSRSRNCSYSEECHSSTNTATTLFVYYVNLGNLFANIAHNVHGRLFNDNGRCSTVVVVVVVVLSGASVSL